MRKIALYTVLTGGYDILQPIHKSFNSGVDCFVVTDNPTNIADGWKQILIDPSDDPHRQQRALKLDFTLIPDLDKYDTVIYIDANITIHKPIQELMRLYRGGILTKQHPKRNCVYDEGWACIDLKKADREAVLRQLSDYMARGIRPETGMYQTGMMVRDRSDQVIEFCKEWLRELEQHTHRDQLSIIPARDHTGITIQTISIQAFNRIFKINPHVVKKKPKIHYLIPYSTDKNIGKACNDAIEQLSAGDDDWIVLRDGDTLFPTPEWGKQIEEALSRHGSKFQLIGAVTNRIGATHQRVEGMFDNWDILDHVRKAFEIQSARFGEIEETNYGVAGFFMAFQVKTWKQIRFTEDINKARLFDTVFYKEVRAKKMRVGIMPGLYVLHLYRPLSSDPRTDVTHLIPNK